MENQSLPPLEVQITIEPSKVDAAKNGSIFLMNSSLRCKETSLFA